MKKAGDRASGIKPTGAQVPATTRQPEGVGTVNTSPPEIIRKAYMTLAQAERAQNKLYEKYDSVELIESPKFRQSGWYAWKVQR